MLIERFPEPTGVCTACRVPYILALSANSAQCDPHSRLKGHLRGPNSSCQRIPVICDQCEHSNYISPHIAMAQSMAGLSPGFVVLVFSIFLTTSMPSTTRPKTTCLLFKNGVGTVVMKNWHPLVFGPELAMLSNPGWLCLSVKLSSANLVVP